MVKILSEEENHLLNRKEVKIIVEATKNPSYPEAEEIVSKEFKTDKENIAIKLIKGKFGRDTFLVEANIYKTKEDKEKTEPKPKVKKAPGQK